MVGVASQPTRMMSCMFGSDGSAAKDGRPSGYTPASMTPMTTSVAPLDALSSPEDGERPRKDGVRVVCSSCFPYMFWWLLRCLLSFLLALLVL